MLNTHLAPGMRKLPSEIDVQILQAILAEEDGGTRGLGDKEKLEAALTSDPLLAIANGDFSISDTSTDTFAWDTYGASGVESGQAILTEDSPFLSNFSQSFTVPADAKALKFTLTDIDLGGQGGQGDKGNITPPDAFEVALLDANTNESLVSDSTLTATDALLSIQNDGTAYFSNNVRIGGATSGEIIDSDKSRTITIDISHLTPGTEATLYFDLLGFGDADSRVVIDDVILSDQNLLTPIAADDTATTVQGQPVAIAVLDNDTDDDGTIATNSVQIQTTPNNGNAIALDDGTVSYIPGTGFAGTDTFIYVVQDNDGQLSNPATVTVTVDNVPPQITQIQIPDNITEGAEIELSAIAIDAGNDELTYSWDVGSQKSEVKSQKLDYIFPDNGIYTGTVTVSDTHGGSNTQTFSVTADNTPPVVDAGENQTTNEGSEIALSGSFTDAGINDTHTYSWDFGDNSELVTNTITPTHSYSQDGTHTATFTVTDSDGAVSSDTTTVTVNNLPPVITSLTGDTEVNEGSTANFSATATDPGNDPLVYIWDFGDGTDPVRANSRSPLAITHAYADDG